MFRKDKKNNFLEKVIINRTNREKSIAISIKEGDVIISSPRLVTDSYINKLIRKKKKLDIKKN